MSALATRPTQAVALGRQQQCRATPAADAAVHRRHRRRPVAVRAQEGGSDREMETQFERELRRRGLDASTPAGEEGGGAGRQQPRPPPSFRSAPADPTTDQLQRSMALNSEGLEGLIPRATELLKLGLSFFLAFGPFIAAVGLGFWAVYAVFGDAFIHGGAPSSGPPPYIDPDMLLAEPTADPMVPLL